MKKLSACTMDCPDACSLVVDTEKRSIRGNPEHPFTRGFICRKGRGFFSRIDAKDRIVTPLMRKGVKWVSVSWDEAMGAIAERLDVLRVHPESILHIHGYGYRGILAQASTHFFDALGAATCYGSLCDDTGITACMRDFGTLTHNDPKDLLNANRIMNWGKDFSRSSTHTAALVKTARERGARVLTITPCGDGRKDESDKTVHIRPGTDRFLAAAVIRILLAAGTPDPGILSRTANWPAFRTLVTKHSVKALCAACDVSPADADLIADGYAAEGATATLIAWGLQRYRYGGQNVRFINALAMISGQVGRKGGGTYYNISSARNFKPWSVTVQGGRHPAGPRRKFLLHNLGHEIKAADPPVEFIWVDGHNVVNQIPDSLAAARAFDKPFVVVVDGFMNDTAQCADVILPPAFALEREEVLGSTLHNYIVHSAKVVQPRGRCRSDFDILRDLGSRLNPAITFPDPDQCLRMGLKDSGIDLDTLRKSGYAKADHPAIAFDGLKFGHPDGLYRFPEELSAEPEPDPDYPLQLLTLVRGRYLHSQIPEADQHGLPRVWISGNNPMLSILDPGKDTYLVTPLGDMPVQVERADDLHPRVVLMRRGGWMKCGHSPNMVIQPIPTDMGDGTAYYSQTCRLENRSCTKKRAETPCL